MDSYDICSVHILQGYSTGTGAIIRLSQCQWSNPAGYHGSKSGPVLNHTKLLTSLCCVTTYDLFDPMNDKHSSIHNLISGPSIQSPNPVDDNGIHSRAVSLELGQSYDCPGASEATLKDMDKIWATTNCYHHACGCVVLLHIIISTQWTLNSRQYIIGPAGVYTYWW